MRFDRCESSEEWLLQMSHLAQSWKRQPISAYWNELQTKAEITRSCSFWLLFRRETVSHGGINRSLTLHTTWKMRAHHFVSFSAIYSTLNKITSQKERQPAQQWCCWIKPSTASKARMLTFPSKRESKHAAVGTLRVISSSEKPMTVLWIILTTTCCAFYLLSPTQEVGCKTPAEVSNLLFHPISKTLFWPTSLWYNFPPKRREEIPWLRQVLQKGVTSRSLHLFFSPL